MRAVAYCRYSTDNQTENSIAYQINAAQEYCARHNMALVDVYADEAQSGTNTDRNALQRLLAACGDGSFDAVIIYDQSRLSRNVVDWFSLRETLSNKNIKLYSCVQTLSEDTLDSSSFLTEGVQAIFNQVHVLETRKKTIAGVTSKAKRAEFCGGTPPLGYDIINGHYVINENEAPAIRMMFEMYVNGYSYRQIMEKLEQKGYKSKWGRKIGTNAIYYLLINERYAGTFFWNKYQYKQMRKRIGKKDNPNHVRIENAFPAIISRDMWERAMKRMQEKKRGTNKAKREYLLSGLITCGYCNGTYTGFTSKNKNSGAETIYYMCGTKGRLKNCSAKNLRADEIEPAVYYTLRDNILNHNLIEKAADDIIGIIKKKPNESAEIKREINKKKKAVANIWAAISNIDKSRPSYEAGLAEIDDLHMGIKLLEARLRENIDSGMIDRNKLIQKLKKDAERIDGDFMQRKAIIKEYVSKVVITNDAIDIQIIGDYDIAGGATPQHAILKFTILRSNLIKYRMKPISP